jgi:lactoylglutathione lyase
MAAIGVPWPARPGGARLGRVTDSATPRVRQLRLVVEVDDFEAAAAFYRDVLGLPVELDLAGEEGEHVLILDAGRATLELSNSQQVAMIVRVEVGRRVAPRLRVAFEVDDATSATEALVAAGAGLVAPPTRTPWNSLNSRLEGPELQLTLFEERPESR